MAIGEPLLDFSNVGTRSRFRRFPGFPEPATHDTLRLAPRACHKVELQAGDLLHVSGVAPAVAVVAVTERGTDALSALGLRPDRLVSELSFDEGPLAGWASAMGLDRGVLKASTVPITDQTFLRASKACTVWAILPADEMEVVSGQSQAMVEIEVDRAGPAALLPEPLGRVIDEFTIPRGTATAYEIAEGHFAQIIDVEGQQCSDFMAFRTDALDRGVERMIDSTATRSLVRQVYPRPGLLDKFFDQDMRPLLQVVQDTCGRHDTFGLACTARGYEERGFPGHLNCSDNISAAISPYGVASRMAWPAINFFWNTWVDPQSQHILTEESHSRPGDYVVMRALTDLVCI
ncbi:MAG: urea carboxylase-associated family protein, partial [Pseudomonadota bacterium]